jgi:hypothetical protein
MKLLTSLEKFQDCLYKLLENCKNFNWLNNRKILRNKHEKKVFAPAKCSKIFPKISPHYSYIIYSHHPQIKCYLPIHYKCISKTKMKIHDQQSFPHIFISKVLLYCVYRCHSYIHTIHTFIIIIFHTLYCMWSIFT